MSEGGAYVHNLIAGAVIMIPEPNRFTPYFFPHSTEIAGLTTILGGDDRYFNNIFVGVGAGSQISDKPNYGTEIYDSAKYPVFMSGNIYYWGAVPCVKEEKIMTSSAFNPKVKLDEKGTDVYLNISPDQQYYDYNGILITSEILGKTRVTKTIFENTDGKDIMFDKDYFGHLRTTENAAAGPFVDLEKGQVILKVW
jgi:hypothetical protein